MSLSEKNNQISRIECELESKSLHIKNLEAEIQRLNMNRVLEKQTFLEQINFSKRICLALMQNFDEMERKVAGSNTI